MTYPPIQLSIAKRLGIDPTVLYSEGFTFADALSRSEDAINSIDLMEAIAGAFAENDVDNSIDLPAFILDDPISDLVNFIDENINGDS